MVEKSESNSIDSGATLAMNDFLPMELSYLSFVNVGYSRLQ